MRSIDLETVPELPTLEPGVILLASDQRITGALQSLVLDHLLLSDGHALWVDSWGNATTVQLARVAPSRRTLERIFVARAFTPFQHYSILEDLPERITDQTTLIVVPAMDWFYDEDTLRHGEGEEMLTEAVTHLQDIGTTEGVPVLVTRHQDGGVGHCISDYTTERLECELTDFGPRFSGSNFETLIFRQNGYLQTTLTFWRRLLEQRHQFVTGQQEAVTNGTY